MITEDGEWIECDSPSCEEKIKNHRWGRTKAEGWFSYRDGSGDFCPLHLPEWVLEWRERKATMRDK